MKKRLILSLLATFLLCSGFFYSPKAHAADPYVSAIIFEGASDISVEDSNGDVFTSSNADEERIQFIDATDFEASVLLLKNSESYKVKFSVESSPMTIEAGMLDSGLEIPRSLLAYHDLEVTKNSKGLITVETNKINRVKFDINNDGSYEKQPTPSFDRTGLTSSADTDGPSISLSMQPSSNNLYIIATDPSDVKTIYYSISDPSKFKIVTGTTKYTGPLDLSQLGFPRQIYVLAEDKLGNRKEWQAYDVSGPIVDFPISLPPGVQEGDLVHFANDPAIYTVAGATFYGFENYQIYRYYQRTNPHTVKEVNGTVVSYDRSSDPASSVLGLPSSYSYNQCGAHPYPAGSLVNDKGTVFLIVGCLKIPFQNIQAFLGLGYSFTNVVSADLSPYNLRQTSGIASSEVPHTWGSWVNRNGTIYYAHPGGFIGVPSYELFIANGGKRELIVPANKYDIEEMDQPGKTLMVLQNGRDAFVAYIDIFGPADNIASPNPIPAASDPPLYGQQADAKRLSDIRQIASALELFYNDYNGYPPALRDLVPNYLGVLPTAPTPPGTGCTESQNTYTYVQGYQGRYQLTFCLGSDTAGVKAGPRILKESGIV